MHVFLNVLLLIGIVVLAAELLMLIPRLLARTNHEDPDGLVEHVIEAVEDMRRHLRMRP